MDFRSFFVLLATILQFGFSAQAQNFEPDVVEVPITKAFIPLGFDSNDRVQVVVEGELPNTCFRLGAIETKVDTKRSQIIIEQHAYYYRGLCLQVLVPFNRTVEIGLLKKGSYTLYDGHTRIDLGKLPVAQATNDGPDDYMYAVVEDAHLGVQNNKAAILVRGQLPGTCWKIKEMRVIVESDEVLTILPIIEYQGTIDDCPKVAVPFLVGVPLPENLQKGRYLVQVRSLNGQSVNKLFNL